MHDHSHHEDLVESISKEYRDILDTTEQGVYIYFDDEHKVCNEKFASLLGYDSANEWGKVTDSFPEVFVDEKSQETLVSAYADAMEKGVASSNKITWKKKGGGTVETTVILVPVSHEGHMFALHFVTA